jgi:ribonucleoside-diphosphate reductase alpha chain
MNEEKKQENAQGGAITASKNILGEMAKFTYTSKYARYNEDKQRREVWEETVRRVRDMHLKKFSYLDKKYLTEIKEAFKTVEDKFDVASMRSMQFGGKAIEAHNARIFNCSVLHVDSIRSFAESFYLLLAGCGVGYGLSEKYLARLPNLVDASNKTGTVVTYVIDDTIEGWADSVEALLMCYFKNTPYTGRKIVFDYSKIRKEGSPLKTGGGKAPGHKGLKNAHTKIKKLLDYLIEERGQYRLETINAYDILMHTADAVLSGGIRRSATSVIFQKNDEKMAKSKTNFVVTKFGGFEKNEKGNYEGWVQTDGKIGGFKGVKYDVVVSEWEYENIKTNKLINWFHIEPQRARSNNSVLLLRDNVTFQEFKDIIDFTRQYGEPGFVFAEHEDTLYNPCITGDTLITTNKGKIKADELVERVTNGEKFLALTLNEQTNSLEYKQILYGEKTKEDAEIIEIETDEGHSIKLTPDHKIFVENKGWIKACDLIEDDTIISYE